MIELWIKYRLVIFLLASCCAVAGIYGYREYTRTLPDTHKLKPAINISARDIIRHFQTNEAKAALKYINKTIAVKGVISVVQDNGTTATIVLNDGGSFSSIICEFEKENSVEIKDLKKGNTVTVKGVCSGYLLDVIMVRCVIEK